MALELETVGTDLPDPNIVPDTDNTNDLILAYLQLNSMQLLAIQNDLVAIRDLLNKTP